MAGNTLDRDQSPFERKRKTREGHILKEQRIRPGADIDTDRIVDADEVGLGYGPEEAEEDDRGLH